MPTPVRGWYTEPSSDSQQWRAEKEGGSRKRAKGFNKWECSAYINALVSGHCPKEPDPPGSDDDDPTPPPSATPVSSAVSTYRTRQTVHGCWVAKKETTVMVPLLERVPDGRYALQLADEGEVFLRVVRPGRGRWKDCLKVQTQHAERYEDAWCRWPDGQVGVFKVSVEDYINLLVCNYRGAAHLYAKLKSRCGRCGIELTDERSRRYGIGPECEKYWPWMISLVDEEEALEEGN